MKKLFLGALVFSAVSLFSSCNGDKSASSSTGSSDSTGTSTGNTDSTSVPAARLKTQQVAVHRQ